MAVQAYEPGLSRQGVGIRSRRWLARGPHMHSAYMDSPNATYAAKGELVIRSPYQPRGRGRWGRNPEPGVPSSGFRVSSFGVFSDFRARIDGEVS